MGQASCESARPARSSPACISARSLTDTRGSARVCVCVRAASACWCGIAECVCVGDQGRGPAPAALLVCRVSETATEAVTGRGDRQWSAKTSEQPNLSPGEKDWQKKDE